MKKLVLFALVLVAFNAKGQHIQSLRVPQQEHVPLLSPAVTIAFTMLIGGAFLTSVDRNKNEIAPAILITGGIVGGATFAFELSEHKKRKRLVGIAKR